MVETEVLHHNEWLSLHVVRKPDAGFDGYVYSHETRCQGRIIAVLPYRAGSDGRTQYLIKSEVTPCWGFQPVRSAITGGFEGGDPVDDAVREMWEETGYRVEPGELVSLGESYASKSADTVYHLYAVDLTGKEQHEAPGDGSRQEAEALSIWVHGDEIPDIMDPQVLVMALRLTRYLHEM